MKAFICALFPFFIFQFASSAQATDTTLVKLYLDSVRLLIDSANYDQALSYGKKALSISKYTLGEQDTLTALAYYQTGRVLQINSALEEALKHHQKALNIRLSAFGEKHSDVAASYNNIGTIFNNTGEYDKALKFYQKALDIRLNVLAREHRDVAWSYNNIGIVYNRKGDYDKALGFHQKALDIRLSVLGEEHNDVAASYNNIGVIYENKGDYDKALEAHRKALNIWLKVLGKNHPYVAASYDNNGIIYYHKGDYDKALEVHQKALDIRLNVFEENHPEVATSYNNIGINYYDKGDYGKALEVHQKALGIRLNVLGKEHPDVAKSYNNIGIIYESKSDYYKALEFYQKALDIRLKVLGSEHPNVAASYNNIGVIYGNIGDYDKALEFHRKVLDIRLKVLGKEHPDVALSYNNIGTINNNIGNYDKALEAHRKALDIRLNILGEKHPVVAISYNNIGEIYDQKKDSNKAVEYFENALRSLDRIQWGYTSVESKQFHLSENYLIFENAIKSRQEAALTNPNQFDLRQTFIYAEKGKSNLLLGAFNKTRAESFAGISDSLLEKEHALRIDLAYYDKKRFEELDKGFSKNDSLINGYNTKIFDLKQEYNSLINQFEKDYPDYYRLKYQTNVVSVEHVQNRLLQSDQALLEYFVGDSSIFAFLVKSDEFQVYKIEKDFPLDKWVDQMIKGMNGYQLLGKNDEQSYLAYSDTFALASAQLYQKLVAPFKNELPEKLIVVPDGKLNYIPFDALLLELPEVNHHFQSHAYLLKDHQISYSYSATLLEEISNKKSKASKSLLAFAPTFGKNDQFITTLESPKGELGRLEYNIFEVERIRTILGGDIFSGEKATKENFTQLAANYHILHLATHGKANDKVGDYSYLAFSGIEDSIENEFLYVRDLYNLKLNADMVVLSACETGIGELQRGEGVISLARGFFYAGAKSIITTLWSVDDEKSMELMELFYKNISKGMKKDEALRKAKLDYLEQHSHFESHPFIWAGYVPLGNMEPVNLKNQFARLMTYGLIALGVFLLLFWLYKRQQRSA